MPVVFDEVIANVEAPPVTAAPDGDADASGPAENQEENVTRIIETQQRWAKRLMAD